MTFNYVGKLKPNQTITAEIMRTVVKPIVRFEVRVRDHRGHITYEGHTFSNMQRRSEIHEYFCMIDPRIPPYAQYLEMESRPYLTDELIDFKLREDIEISDFSSNDPSVAGGDNGHGIALPAIILAFDPVATIDLSAGTKVQGASRGQVQGDEGSESESTDSEDNPLFRIAQSIRRGEKVQVSLEGYFEGYQGIDSVVQFRQPYYGPIPDSLQSLFN
jgi:hypothetical protein